MEGFRPNESLNIEQNEHGSYDALELGESIKKEGDEMREKDPEINASLSIIENPDMPNGVKEIMIRNLNTIRPDFNWEIYIDLIREEKPTLN